MMGRDLKGPWVMASGTSFSAPEVAGMVTLYLSAAPNAPPAQVTEHFEQAARDIPDTPRDGAGIANCAGALDLVRDDNEEDDSGNGNGRDGGSDGGDGSDGSGDESGEDNGSGGNEDDSTDGSGDDPTAPDTPEEVDFSPPSFTEDGIGQFVGTVQRVIDGDTMYVDLALTPFDLRDAWDLRLLGIDAAEIFGVPKDSDEYRRGIEHKRFVEYWFADAPVTDDGYPFLIRTTETGKYGRKVAVIKKRSDGSILNRALLDEFGDNIFSPQDFASGENADRHESAEKQRE
jgi:endonuclease YncB( thermonuclease family)